MCSRGNRTGKLQCLLVVASAIVWLKNVPQERERISKAETSTLSAAPYIVAGQSLRVSVVTQQDWHVRQSGSRFYVPRPPGQAVPVLLSQELSRTTNSDDPSVFSTWGFLD